MREKSLEQLHQLLSKHLPLEYREALDELTRRASEQYVKALFEKEDLDNVTPILSPKDLQHLNGFEKVIAQVTFPTKEDRDRFIVADHDQLIGEVIVEKSHYPRNELTVGKKPIPAEWITGFQPLARGWTTVSKDGAYNTIRHLRKLVTQMQTELREKTTMLDAWGHVWCTGNCAGGQFQNTEGIEITPEMAEWAVTNVFRLLMRVGNMKWATSSWHHARVKRLMDWYEKRPHVKERVEFAQSVLATLKTQLEQQEQQTAQEVKP